MFVAAICSDQQVPYHDPRALDVAGQIIEAEKVDLQVQNGDWADFRAISRYPLRNRDDRCIGELKHELKSARERFHTWIKGTKPKKVRWLDGNHCWRLQRAFNNLPNAHQILDIPEVDAAMSIPSLFHFSESKIPIKYVGEYPQGCWLHDQLEPERNCWVEHGYTTRQRAGYTVANTADKRWTSTIVGHCERLSLAWTRKMGRDYFMIEGGSMSLIQEPGKGNGIYQGVPHSVPEYMDSRQGFAIVYYDGGQFHPFILKIRDGKCFWRGKLWRS